MKLNIEGIKGCTDHGCIFGHPGGMGTNGGCACLRDIRPAGERLRLLRNVHLLVKAIEHLHNELTAARVENDNARHDIERLMAACSAEASEVERLVVRCASLSALLFPRVLREAVAGDIGWVE